MHKKDYIKSRDTRMQLSDMWIVSMPADGVINEEEASW